MTESIPEFPARQSRVLTPTQLNRLARGLLEDAFAMVWVEAEISNYTRAASGHWYFTLKDAQAQIRCAMFKTHNMYVRAKPAEGLKVVVRGRVSLYEARGDYQLICEHMEPAGLGDLLQAFELLKAKLAAEGLTDSARKRALPRMPRRLAVLTSPQGAAVRDVLAVLRRRWPLLAVDIYPCQVQGVEAPAQLRAALAAAQSATPAYDLILLTRGGGSIEDLAAFNDEALAHAIASSPVVTIAAVGHETDFTIAELVADLRAPTPSAAAEQLSPDCQRLLEGLNRDRLRLARAWQLRLQAAQQRNDAEERLLRAHHPQVRVAAARSRVRQTCADLASALAQRQRQRQQRVDALLQRLRHEAPARRIARAQSQAQSLHHRLQRYGHALCVGHRSGMRELSARIDAARPRIDLLRLRSDTAWRALRMLGPQATLERGFVLLRESSSGALLTRAGHVQPGMELEAQFADGRQPLRSPNTG